ncbi:hypothetical protein KB681_gp47 [Burkholderia phage Mica]|uniref:Uncharacterized protein n=1 Tax=Burkholderia phage Mica TaxID=2767579 RepID=A0A873WKR7_9CAUD|nr:hypothetical protein KB681_gp47 [Burkholderia phage Mica]QPB08665.1 hypothetical protein CPT_Mica_053 [Burkholderia phage Mica]
MNEPTIRAIDRKEWLPWHYVDDQGTAWPVNLLPASVNELHLAVRVARFAIMRALMI